MVDLITRAEIAVISEPEKNRLLGRTEDNRAPSYDQQGNPVYNRPLIKPIPHRRGVYLALVEATVIRLELQREIKNRPPMAEDSKTTRFDIWFTDKAAGRYIEHHPERSATYPVSREFLRDEILRRDTRKDRQAAQRAQMMRRVMPVQPPIRTPHSKTLSAAMGLKEHSCLSR